MPKCGKGCMPECEYFTTGGCISPFNCQYKIETGYINSATSIPTHIPTYMEKQMSMTAEEIEHCLERFTMGKTTDVMNFDYAGTLAYIQRLKAENAELRDEADENAALSIENKMRADRLEAENAVLRERLERSIELPCIEPMTTYDWDDEKGIGEPHFGERFQLLYRDEDGEFIAYIGLDKEEAEARLAELKGGKE